MKFLSTGAEFLEEDFIYDVTMKKYGAYDLHDKFYNNSIFSSFNFKTRKLNKKTLQGKKLKIFTASYRRDKNLNLLNMYLNLSTKQGNKETYSKYMNRMIYYFMTYFYEKDEFFYFQPRFFYFYFLAKTEKIYYLFENIFENCVYNTQIIFNIHYQKLEKSQRIKYKQKYKIVLKHIPIKRRVKHILTLINRSATEMTHKNLDSRILKSVTENCFNPKDSYIWRRKMYIYSIALEDYKKKNE